MIEKPDVYISLSTMIFGLLMGLLLSFSTNYSSQEVALISLLYILVIGSFLLFCLHFLFNFVPTLAPVLQGIWIAYLIGVVVHFACNTATN